MYQASQRQVPAKAACPTLSAFVCAGTYVPVAADAFGRLAVPGCDEVSSHTSA